MRTCILQHTTLPGGRLQGDVLADGSDAKEVAQWEARRAAERELKAAEEAVSKGEEVRACCCRHGLGAGTGCAAALCFCCL